MLQQLGNCYRSCRRKFSFHSVCCDTGYSCSGLSKRSARLPQCKFQCTSISLPRTNIILGWICFNNNSDSHDNGNDRIRLLPKQWTFVSEKICKQKGNCVSALAFGWSGSSTLHCFTCPLHIYRCNNRSFLCYWHWNLLWNLLLCASISVKANIWRSWPAYSSSNNW